MESVNIAKTPAELYSAILIDTPLGMQWNHSSQDTFWPEVSWLMSYPIKGVLIRDKDNVLTTHDVVICICMQ